MYDHVEQESKTDRDHNPFHVHLDGRLYTGSEGRDNLRVREIETEIVDMIDQDLWSLTHKRLDDHMTLSPSRQHTPWLARSHQQC